jgi:hypothetical protein
VKGEFVASDVARTYCIAEHFDGQPVPVSVRYSNGLGGPEQHDGWSDVRGMATRFHLPDGRATDLIATTLGEFFVQTVGDFFEFTRVAKLEPYPRRTWQQKLYDILRLKVPPRDPYPNETKNVNAGALRYADQHRFAHRPRRHRSMLHERPRPSRRWFRRHRSASLQRLPAPIPTARLPRHKRHRYQGKIHNRRRLHDSYS